MKTFIQLTIFLLIYVGANSQTTLPRDNAGKIAYAESIKTDSTEADELYRRAKTWVLENFTNMSQTVKKDDKATHEIILFGTGECYAPKSFGDTIDNAGLSYTLKIRIGKNKYSYVMSDFIKTDKWKGGLPVETIKAGKKQMDILYTSIEELAGTLTASLKIAMAKKISMGME